MSGTEPGTGAQRASPTSADLERVILGAAPELTAEEAAEAAGISLDSARRLWRALGFADPGEAVAFTRNDVAALLLVAGACEATGFDLETVLRVTRAIGQTVARLAEWEVAILATTIEDVTRDPRADSDPSLMRGVLELMESMGPGFEELLLYSWRRHLAASIGRMEQLGAEEDDLLVTQATVGFADLVSFTSLTNELGEDEIGDLVEVFESRCADVVSGHHGRVVKTLGDSVLFLASSADQAIDIALDIVAIIGRDERLPDVHVGMATGSVVLRMGDVYGPVVNLASRLTGVARRNRVIIDEATAALLPETEFETRKLPARPVRGFGDIEPVTVARTRPRHG